jgi:hypothetical protein
MKEAGDLVFQRVSYMAWSCQLRMHWWDLVMSACAYCNPTHEKEIWKTDSLSTFFSFLPSLEGSSTHFYSNAIYCKKQQKDIYLWSKVVCWLCPTEALWEPLLSRYKGVRIKSWLNGYGYRFVCKFVFGPS